MNTEYTDTSTSYDTEGEELFAAEKIEEIPNAMGKLRVILKSFFELLHVRFNRFTRSIGKSKLVFLTCVIFLLEIRQSYQNLICNIPNKYAAFYYPQRFMIGMTSGLVIAFWITLVVLFYMGIWVIPIIQSLLEIAGNVCLVEVPSLGRQYLCYLSAGKFCFQNSI